MKKILFILAAIFLSHLYIDAQDNHNLDNIPEDIKKTKVYKRIEWFTQQRAYPFETIPYEKYRKELKAEITRINLLRQKDRSVHDWTSIGPKGVQSQPYNDHWGVLSGRVKTLAVHPTDTSTVYIGAASGGIWKTTDGGENWLDIGRDLESLSFGAIAIDPDNPDVIYAGSGEAFLFTSYTQFYGSGLYKSTDGGDSWIQITNGFGEYTHFSDIEVSPHNSNYILASITHGNCNLENPMENEGVWKSTDAGISWTKALDIPIAYDVLYHPADTNIVYSAFGGRTSASGFYISYDKGDSWTQSNTGMLDSTTIARMQVDIARSDPSILYAVAYEPGDPNVYAGTSRAYKSVDSGQSWNHISVGRNLGGYYPGAGWLNQGFYDLCIAVNPSDPDHVFIGNIELHECVDGYMFNVVRPHGNSAYGSLAHMDYHALVFAPSENSYLYIGCDGGLFKSTDAGISASSQNLGLEALQFYRIASHPTNTDIVFGGLQDNGNTITEDGGYSWTQVTGGDGMVCFFDPVFPDSIIYGSVTHGGLMKSINGGYTFNYISNIPNCCWLAPFLMHPDNNEILYTANTNIYRSTNAGGSFLPIASEVAPNAISTMAQSQVNPDNMIFATGGGIVPEPEPTIIVKISNDGGYTWTDVTDNIQGEVRWISRVTTDPLDENTMYVVRNGFSDGNKIWKTTDLGQNWINISGDLANIPCSDLFIDPEIPGHLYVANDIGVYLSQDGGETWNHESEGMPYVPAIDFDYVDTGNERILRIGTHGRSIYQANLDDYVITDEIQQKLKSYSIINAHAIPNPFSKATIIEFENTHTGRVEVIIVNSRGEYVEKLFSGIAEAGKHRLYWAPENQSQGIYFAILITGDAECVIKLVLLR